MKALVIDESQSIRNLLSLMLKEFGWEIIEASNGQEAYTKLQNQGDVDLALVDWNLPFMNGLDFIKLVRKNDGYNEVRLMMVTSETSSENVISAFEAGADEFIIKPFDKETIREKMNLLGLSVS